MNRWTEDVLAYLGARKDRAARALLARSDCPRPAPEKQPVASVQHQEKQARRADREQDEAIRLMHFKVWAYNQVQTYSLGSPFGRCDCGCGYAFRHSLDGELDHWKGRHGADAHTRENGWRLRRECHEMKDGRRPIPAGEPTFNERRKAYCERAGIPFVPRKELIK